MTNTQKITIFTLIAVGVFLIVFLLKPFSVSEKNSPPLSPQAITSEKPAGGNFTLTSINGKQSLKDFQGKLVLLYFGYTYCPDICPTDLGNLAVAYRALTEDEQAQVQILFVTVDPERDTATRMAEYTRYFDADMIGLTGSNKEIATVAKQYGVVYMKAKNEGTPASEHDDYYTVDHSAFTYVIDQTGQLQTQIVHAMPSKHIQNLIKTYLTLETTP